MRAHRGRRAAHILAVVGLLAAGLIAAEPAAHAVTSCGAGCPIVTSEDDYTVAYSATGVTLTKDAAHGVLANDTGPATTTVDLADTVDLGTTRTVTTYMGFTATINLDGSFTYKSAGSFSGNDSFTYYAWDSADHTNIDSNTVSITIVPVVHNDIYQLHGGILSVAMPGVLATDSGVDATTLVLAGTSAKGGQIVDNGAGAFSYTPPFDFVSGLDSFTYDVWDINNNNDYVATVFIYTDAVAPSVSITQPHSSVMLSPKFTVAWSGHDTGGSGLSHYDVEEQGAAWNGRYGSWAGWHLNTTATKASFSGTYGRSYCIRVRAVDNANNKSPWSQTCISVPLKAGSLSYSSGWHTGTSSAYFGGYARYTTTKYARVTRSSIRAKHISLVVTRSKISGTVQVLWNNVAVRNINLYYNGVTVHRRLIPVLSWSSTHTGTLTLKVLTAGKYVTLEGLDVFAS
jgi:hypothetical protein